jgi:hypothetical protein
MCCNRAASLATTWQIAVVSYAWSLCLTVKQPPYSIGVGGLLWSLT